MITQLRKLLYEQRLKECKLTKLEERRKRGELLETPKIMHSLEKILEVPSLQELIPYEGGTV